MKKFSVSIVLLALVLAVGFAFVACDDGSNSGGATGGGTQGGGGGGTFTLTDIPSQYNGKYAHLQTSNGVRGAQSVNGQVYTLVPISNGRAILPLFRQGVPYTDTGTTNVVVTIFDQSTGTAVELNNGYIALISFIYVSFTDGSATQSWASGIQR